MEKVLLISFEFPPTVGGAGAVGYDYAEYLSSNDVKVSVITYYNKNRVLTNNKYDIFHFKSPDKIQPIFFYKEFLKHYDDSYNNIILNDAGACLMASLFFNEKLKNKCIVFLHGTEYEKLMVNKSMFFKLVNSKGKYTTLLKECKAIIGVSDHLKQKFIRLSGLNFLTDKITIIKNTLDPRYGDNTSANNPFSEFTDSGSIILFTASRIIKGKGYDRMFDLFSSALKVNNNFFWIIAGEGLYKNDFENKVKESGLNENVKFIGAVDRGKLSQYYSHADLFWLLSDFDEGFPLVYLEAALCGCPVMGNDKGGVKEAVSQKTGFLVVNDDQALKILYQKDFLKINRNKVRTAAAQINKDARELLLQILVK